MAKAKNKPKDKAGGKAKGAPKDVAKGASKAARAGGPKRAPKKAAKTAKAGHAKVKSPRSVKAEGRQYAVLPYRMTEAGLPEVLLIVSRETRRWVIPKGWPMPGRKPHEAAAREAFEEAGIIGMPSPRPIGSYGYDKRLDAGKAIPCEVTVYPFAFLEQRKRWPERKERGHGKWVRPGEAADMVDEPGLSEIIRGFGRALEPGEEAAEVPAGPRT